MSCFALSGYCAVTFSISLSYAPCNNTEGNECTNAQEGTVDLLFVVIFSEFIAVRGVEIHWMLETFETEIETTLVR
ncbi:hypothetical protein E2C01_006480 [Portunus trituberculatus]|uniref:Uncharacterized protein n=1 Tax=Portunus trituberculatus TaxID=210409 RepID=A0A5B7CZN5_PORTR|nr:hypothetical protein [Portunus trituberculatus]